ELTSSQNDQHSNGPQPHADHRRNTDHARQQCGNPDSPRPRPATAGRRWQTQRIVRGQNESLPPTLRYSSGIQSELFESLNAEQKGAVLRTDPVLEKGT